MTSAVLEPVELESDKMPVRPPTEIERQHKAVAALGEGFEFPLFNGRQAIESQRKSGYRNTARAAREIVDNAYEAGAKNVHVVFRRPEEKTRKKGERRETVTAVAFVDDGPGMIPNMARYALSWGGGTRFENPTGIGRFGFGLPNASINQTRRVEVYTRTDSKADWTLVVLDITPGELDKLQNTGLATVKEPQFQVQLPEFVLDYLKKERITLNTGTIVVWDKPDRLSRTTATPLREMMLDDFGVIYRNLLDRFQLKVDGKRVERVDPLFLNPHGRFYLPPDEGGAEKTLGKTLTVKYSFDPTAGQQSLTLLRDAEELRTARTEATEDPNVSVGTMVVTIARFPYGFAAESIKVNGKKKRFSNTDVEFKRLQIRKQRRGISCVRADREIDVISNFPTTSKSESEGLGRWPVLQAYALHWGMEIKFSPQLDEAFGIGNDKQTINPIEDVWRVLHQAEVDQAVMEEQRKQQESRKKKAEEETIESLEDPDFVNPAAEAAAEAESLIGLPSGGTESDSDVDLSDGEGDSSESVSTTEDMADSDTTGESNTAIQGPIDESVSSPSSQMEAEVEADVIADSHGPIKYIIKFFHSEGGVFFKPDYGDNLSRVVWINKAHAFFTDFYVDVANHPNKRARQAVDLLLLALAGSELKATQRTKVILKHLRESQLSQFLSVGLGVLAEMQVTELEEEEEDVE